MERRRDPRHALRYGLTLKCLRSARIYHELATADISASGMSVRVEEAHALETGDRVEIQLYARIRNHEGEDVLPMATRAIVIRMGPDGAALRYEQPLTY